jgi:hypothetical protein
MKRLLPLLIFLLICSFAQTSSARMNAYIAGSVAAVGTTYTDCSQVGTHEFAWFGDYTGDTDKACFGATATDGTLSGASVVAGGTDPGTAAPTSAGNCLKVTANSQYLRYTITSKNILDSAEGQFQVDVYLPSGGATGDDYLLRSVVDASNYIKIYIGSSDAVTVIHTGQGSQVTVYSTDTITAETWTTVYVRWSVANNQVGVKIGAGSWRTACPSGCTSTDTDSVTAFASEPTTVNFGNDVATDDFYLDNIYLDTVSGL